MKKLNLLPIIILVLIALPLVLLNTCTREKQKEKPVQKVKTSENLVKPEKEFRAAWVATVANINWPSNRDLTSEQQQQEALDWLDLLKENNFNAVIFQVRPQCDALYQSDLEPWSYYLTGEQGKAPDPFYDPLDFWIEAAHERGLELHAWLNPYRAHHTVGGEVTKASIVKKKPELALFLKNGYWWLDPSKKATQKHSLAVVEDIVNRYDVDGIHFDDYFYPYPDYNGFEDFPDDESWAQYQKGGGDLSRGDWRRNSVNVFIEDVYESIKAIKPHVKFGLSPFGTYRPHHPESIGGYDQYDKLYADAKLWLNEGWIDYFTPQLYWPTNRIDLSFPILLGWWENENTKGRHLWPGISTGRLENEKAVDEALNQIMFTRGLMPHDPGIVHWSIGTLVNNGRLPKALIEGPYKKQALVPPSPWLEDNPPKPPEVTSEINGEKLLINWSHKNEKDVFKWVVYFKHGEDWDYKILPQKEHLLAVDFFLTDKAFLKRNGKKKIEDVNDVLNPITAIAVTAVDRLGNESHQEIIAIPEVSAIEAPPIERVVAEYEAEKKAEPKFKTEAVVKLGIEVLVEDHLDLIKGKRIGLITNPSAVGPDLRSDVDILANTTGVDVVALFGAEHGIRGAKQGKITKEGAIDPQTGIPVYSLYGESYAPKKKWLDKIDVMIFDIQGVGSAWYTFKYSMSFAMEACAKAGIPFIVLDRPNPLGGKVVEGPYLNMGRIFRHKLPLRHGMTYGELATMWNDTEKFGADLTVIKMKNWSRSMTWDDTGLFWVMPSPNMGTLETALVYPGQCLFERMNMSEGRGTTKPFLMTGAPWVDCVKAAEDLNSRGIEGAIFRPINFIPKMTGSNPRKKPWNEMCSGIEIMLTDYKKYRSVEAAIHIIDACRKTSPGSLNWSPPKTIKLLDKKGMTPEKVVEACQKEVAGFVHTRKQYLLYR
jgi:uncharacterized protein YbbC (DUF1343 family)/uncharacterized lipoprotein YddW (UPF0748 family)